MARAFRAARGGIAGIVAELRKNGDAIEADLTRSGRSLRELFTGSLTWRELGNYISNPIRGSAYANRLLGETSQWDVAAHLLAGIFDLLSAGNWQRGGGKGPRPRQLPRPGVSGQNERRYGDAGDRSPAEVKAELRRMAGRD